jgi:putative IMPACT (imprinted ancient) family translation regulator
MINNKYGTVMAYRKEVFNIKKNVKKDEKPSMQRNCLLTIEWHDMRDIYMLNIKHNDSMVNAPASNRKPIRKPNL